MVGRDALAHALLDRHEVVGRERARQLEVVVEAILDRRTDAELRSRKQVKDRLGHDVRRRVAHRVELVLGTGVQQLLGRAALGGLEDSDLRPVRQAARHPPKRPPRSPVPGSYLCLRRITEPLVPRQDERFTPAVPPAFAARCPCALGPR